MIHAIPMFHLASFLITEQCEKNGSRGRKCRPRVARQYGPKKAVQRSHRTGVLEKREPLPVGRYWIDVFGADDKESFQAWAYGRGEKVQILKTEHYESTAGDWSPGSVQETPEGDWYLFEVKSPVEWGMAKYLGWPNVATADIQSPADTVQKPDPEPGFFDNIKPPGLGLQIGLVLGVGVVLAVGIGYAIRSVR